MIVSAVLPQKMADVALGSAFGCAFGSAFGSASHLLVALAVPPAYAHEPSRDSDELRVVRVVVRVGHVGRVPCRIPVSRPRFPAAPQDDDVVVPLRGDEVVEAVGRVTRVVEAGGEHRVGRISEGEAKLPRGMSARERARSSEGM